MSSRLLALRARFLGYFALPKKILSSNGYLGVLWLPKALFRKIYLKLLKLLKFKYTAREVQRKIKESWTVKVNYENRLTI